MKCLLVIAIVTSCAGSSKVRLGGQGGDVDYDDIRTRWTREATDLELFDTALDVTATFRSWEFRQVYAERVIAWYQLKGTRAAQVRAQEEKAHGEANEFYLAARTHLDDWNDFGNMDSTWRLTLINEGGNEVEPLKVDRIRNVTPLDKALFPYSDPFSMTYRIYFPKTFDDGSPVIGEGADSVTLKITGPLGEAVLTWEMG